MKSKSFTYSTTQITDSTSTEKLRQLSKQLDWLQYEVDPKWARFCSFGPDDIGGVWEKLGVIRKRPPIAMLLVEKQIMNQLNNDFMKTVFDPIHIGGIPIVESPAGNFIVSKPPDFGPINMPVEPLAPLPSRRFFYT